MGRGTKTYQEKTKMFDCFILFPHPLSHFCSIFFLFLLLSFVRKTGKSNELGNPFRDCTYYKFLLEEKKIVRKNIWMLTRISMIMNIFINIPITKKIGSFLSQRRIYLGYSGSRIRFSLDLSKRDDEAV